MFCFGDEAEAKSAAALAATAAKDQDKNTSSVEQQAMEAASQGSQEQVQPHKAAAHRKTQKLRPKQNLADSGSDSLQQPASAPDAFEQVTASEASEAVGAAGTSSSSADTSDEEASGSERVSDMTPQQLEGLKVVCSCMSRCAGTAVDGMYNWQPRQDKACPPSPSVLADPTLLCPCQLW
ncbi:hypothetical protein ABBQ38_013527 [Trebouxia sp. C0009 RCD-2024]